MNFKHILVTGGCGFIGSNFIRRLLSDDPSLHITNVDCLTYSGNLANLLDVAEIHGSRGSGRYHFQELNICDFHAVSALLSPNRVDGSTPPVDSLVHFAAETHVDRSICGPKQFMETNIMGTATLLDASVAALDSLPDSFRFIHISTDEVYGSLAEHDAPFEETTPLSPNSPYAASKAASDFLAQSYFRTYDFPVIITRCSNNYGPYQFPEKLFPLCITRGLRDESIPIYGDGLNVRDWIHVHDHCDAVRTILEKGCIGEIYNIGGISESSNIDIVEHILRGIGRPSSLISFVPDRPGHDRRYAMNINKIIRETGWKPTISLEDGIEATISWYSDNEGWWKPLLDESYRMARTMYE